MNTVSKPKIDCVITRSLHAKLHGNQTIQLDVSRNWIKDRQTFEYGSSMAAGQTEWKLQYSCVCGIPYDKFAMELPRDYALQTIMNLLRRDSLSIWCLTLNVPVWMSDKILSPSTFSSLVWFSILCKKCLLINQRLTLSNKSWFTKMPIHIAQFLSAISII